MATIVKGILQAKIEGVIKQIDVQTGSTSVIVDASTGKTLATALAEIIADLESAVAGGVTTTQVETMINEKIAELVDSAPTTLDTLKEIADAITTNQGVIESLNAAIGNKVDKVDGKGLSTNDFTTALLTKLNGITEGATKVEKSTTNGNIKINGTETVVYTHPTGAGNTHLPTGGTVGQVLRATGSGAGEWGVAIRSGVSVPDDLAEGEMFIQIIEE
ncbi:MAG: hypothetical protein IJZ69_04230 [Bacteroidales bacterium]|nr:hypothetical protein [Bacteroidales bacterium]MBQ8809521.1 hypothetical protein [Bacteroidales bacterium]